MTELREEFGDDAVDRAIGEGVSALMIGGVPFLVPDMAGYIEDLGKMVRRFLDSDHPEISSVSRLGKSFIEDYAKACELIAGTNKAALLAGVTHIAEKTGRLLEHVEMEVHAAIERGGQVLCVKRNCDDCDREGCPEKKSETDVDGDDEVL